MGRSSLFCILLIIFLTSGIEDLCYTFKPQDKHHKGLVSLMKMITWKNKISPFMISTTRKFKHLVIQYFWQVIPKLMPAVCIMRHGTLKSQHSTSMNYGHVLLGQYVALLRSNNCIKIPVRIKLLRVPGRRAQHGLAQEQLVLGSEAQRFQH